VLGTPLITPALYDANRCIAMTNSVVSSAPRPWVSDKFHILPKTSFGSRAFSNICFAMTPESIPFSAPDFSNNNEYSLIFSGARGGTRIGGDPACVGLAGGPVFWEVTGGIGCPSNRGRGPAVRKKVSYGCWTWVIRHVLRCVASSAEGGRPACAWPMSLKTTPNPDGVNNPLFSVSAICQI
jgi:hypothetical protein